MKDIRVGDLVRVNSISYTVLEYGKDIKGEMYSTIYDIHFVKYICSYEGCVRLVHPSWTEDYYTYDIQDLTRVYFLGDMYSVTNFELDLLI